MSVTADLLMSLLLLMFFSNRLSQFRLGHLTNYMKSSLSYHAWHHPLIFLGFLYVLSSTVIWCFHWALQLMTWLYRISHVSYIGFCFYFSSFFLFLDQCSRLSWLSSAFQHTIRIPYCILYRVILNRAIRRYLFLGVGAKYGVKYNLLSLISWSITL